MAPQQQGQPQPASQADWFAQNAPPPSAAPTAASSEDWFASNAPPSQGTTPPAPGAVSRFTQATLGTGDAWGQAKSEWNDFVNDPVGSLTRAAKTAAMMPVNLAYQATHHPLDTAESILPVNRAIGDVKAGNYSGALGDVAGGAANMALIAKGKSVTEGPDAAAAALKDPEAAVSAANDFQKAIPATKSAPYTPEQYVRARPYLEEAHSSNPISVDTGVSDTVDAANQGISKIEDKVGEAIRANPQDLIRTNTMADVNAALAKNQRGQQFVAAGQRELAGFGLDQPKTVAQADAIRRQLNLENQAALSKNSYDLAAARASDPAFAAREAASQSLRTGIYNQLEQRGVQGVKDLRQDEGALLAIRDAAQNQIYNGEKMVAGSAPGGLGRQVAARAVQGGLTAGGAYVGSSLAGPAGAAGGAAVGAGAGELATRFFAPGKLSRNELVARSFEKQVAGSPEYLDIPQGPQIKGLLGSGTRVTPAPPVPGGTMEGGMVAVDPSTRAARLGLLLNAKPGEALIPPEPRGPLQLPAKSGAPLLTPLAGESARDYLKRISR
jgi:hypothetical protein